MENLLFLLIGITTGHGVKSIIKQVKHFKECSTVFKNSKEPKKYFCNDDLPRANNLEFRSVEDYEGSVRMPYIYDEVNEIDDVWNDTVYKISLETSNNLFYNCLENIKEQLKRAVRDENYALASELRDRIKLLED